MRIRAAHHDQYFYADLMSRLPPVFRAAVRQNYLDKLREDRPGSRREANQSLLEVSEQTGGYAFRLSASDSEIVLFSKRKAREVRDVVSECVRGVDMRGNPANLDPLQSAEQVAIDAGIQPPVGRTMTEQGRLNRLMCHRHWRRQVRKAQGRAVEAAAVRYGLVSDRAGLYVSDDTLERRRGQKRRNRQMLESMLAVNELGQEYTLAELAALSVSNPVIRRGELMVRMAGFEQWADRRGHVGEFYTWTCPSRMHPSSDKYDGTTPREAQQYLCKQWAKVRACFSRAGVDVYGFRVAEPHKDGCPHWHLLLFMAEGNRDGVRETMRRYALMVDGDEQGAARHRFTAVAIDKRKGTAAGYLAKYVAKNIDAFGIDYVDEDMTGKRDPRECAERVDAWASTWGIRQFQQVGGESVTIWRELRRVRDKQPGAIEAARYRADQGDWFGYMGAMKARPVVLQKEYNDTPGQYGEPLGNQIRGLLCGDVITVTRVHEWRVERGKRLDNDNDDSGVRNRVSVEHDKKIGAQRPWSPVNNCTDEQLTGIYLEYEQLAGQGPPDITEALVEWLH